MIKALLFVGFSFFNPPVPADSTGTETIDGKVFVIHKVEEKETLYGISKRYGSTIDEVLRYNPSADAGLEIGQILKVPYTRRVYSKTPAGGIKHTVKEKETLYSISRAYNVAISDIKQWNGLTSDNLSLGQELIIRRTNTNQPVTSYETEQVVKSPDGKHVVSGGETLFSISRRYGVTVNDLREWNSLSGNDLKIGQTLVVEGPQRASVQPVNNEVTTVAKTQTVETPVENNTTQTTSTTSTRTTTPGANEVVASNDAAPASQQPAVTISETVRGTDEIVQGGLAELIEGTEGNRKYLALHRTAPIGTILKVRNEMNNREVFVRVMGKLPDTALNDKLIIKISKSAYDRLGAIDPKFRVEVTYYKPQQ